MTTAIIGTEENIRIYANASAFTYANQCFFFPDILIWFSPITNVQTTIIIQSLKFYLICW